MAKQKETQSTGMVIPKVFKVGEIEVNKTSLIAQRDEDVKLVVNGVEDREGYKNAVALRTVYRTTRTTLERYRKEVSAPHQAFVKRLKEVTDELGAIAYTGEQYFDQMITAVDDEKERIKQEQLMAEARRIQARVNEINKLGAQFDGETYTFPYDADIAIDQVGIKEATDDEFSHFLQDVQFCYNQEQERIYNELLIKEQEETERLAEVERQRLLAQQNADQEKELLQKRNNLRVKELKPLGAIEGRGGFVMPANKGDLLVPLSTVTNHTDEIWDMLISEIENYVEPAPEVLITPDSDTHPLDGGDFKSDDEEENLYSAVADYRKDHPLDEVQYTEVVLRFDVNEPFTDVDISGGRILRVYPDVDLLSDLALLGTDSVQSGYSGNIQSLAYIILSKAKIKGGKK